MGGGKLPPRQKMISMMYLVLTALLAMNVSKDILNAFIVINEGLSKTNENFVSKNLLTIASFEKAVAKDPKGAPLLAKAKEAAKFADEINHYIIELKKHIIMVTDKKDAKAADSLIYKMRSIDAKDNYDVPTHILIGGEPSSPIKGQWSAVDLKARIIKIKEGYIKLIEDAAAKKLILPDQKNNMIKSIKFGLATEGGVEFGVKTDWENLNFYHLPLAAVITNLTKIQSDVDNTEADMINFFYNSMGATDIKISGFEAAVMAKTNYLLSGDKYEADVLLVAQSSSTKPRIFLGDTTSLLKSTTGAKALEVINGIGKYSVPAGGEGEIKWGGVIELDKPDGSIERYPFFSKYTVAKPAAAVSPDKMNVFYIGVDNPVTVSAAGVDPTALQPSISSGGTMSGSKGKYMVKVTSGTGTPPKVSITVNAKFGTGTKNMGAFEFRVKRLPDPYAFCFGKRGDITLKKGELAGAGGVVAKFENFDFDLPVTVSNFTMTANIKGILKEIQVTGNKYTPEVASLISSLPNGTKVYIENVKARLPDGSSRNLPSINIKING